ncbi:MAG TPA: helicase, partial [Armatimonadota bacterium]|nr:helicase [Armatimonadota bacterium]
GATHQKLHEEVVTAGGWIEEGRFRRMGVTEIQNALAHVRPGTLPAALADGLRQLWPTLEKSLRTALQVRQEEVSRSLTRRLEELAETEKREVTAILTELKQTLESGLAQPDQLTLDLEDDQEGRNLDALRRRADAIPEEIVQECALIDRRYAEPSARLFPVAVAFLVPERELRAGGHRHA